MADSSGKRPPRQKSACTCTNTDQLDETLQQFPSHPPPNRSPRRSRNEDGSPRPKRKCKCSSPGPAVKTSQAVGSSDHTVKTYNTASYPQSSASSRPTSSGQSRSTVPTTTTTTTTSGQSQSQEWSSHQTPSDPSRRSPYSHGMGTQPSAYSGAPFQSRTSNRSGPPQPASPFGGRSAPRQCSCRTKPLFPTSPNNQAGLNALSRVSPSDGVRPFKCPKECRNNAWTPQDGSTGQTPVSGQSSSQSPYSTTSSSRPSSDPVTSKSSETPSTDEKTYRAGSGPVRLSVPRDLKYTETPSTDEKNYRPKSSPGAVRHSAARNDPHYPDQYPDNRHKPPQNKGVYKDSNNIKKTDSRTQPGSRTCRPEELLGTPANRNQSPDNPYVACPYIRSQSSWDPKPKPVTQAYDNPPSPPKSSPGAVRYSAARNQPHYPDQYPDNSHKPPQNEGAYKDPYNMNNRDSSTQPGSRTCRPEELLGTPAYQNQSSDNPDVACPYRSSQSSRILKPTPVSREYNKLPSPPRTKPESITCRPEEQFGVPGYRNQTPDNPDIACPYRSSQSSRDLKPAPVTREYDKPPGSKDRDLRYSTQDPKSTPITQQYDNPPNSRFRTCPPICKDSRNKPPPPDNAGLQRPLRDTVICKSSSQKSRGEPGDPRDAASDPSRKPQSQSRSRFIICKNLSPSAAISTPGLTRSRSRSADRDSLGSRTTPRDQRSLSNDRVSSRSNQHRRLSPAVSAQSSHQGIPREKRSKTSAGDSSFHTPRGSDIIEKGHPQKTAKYGTTAKGTSPRTDDSYGDLDSQQSQMGRKGKPGDSGKDTEMDCKDKPNEVCEAEQSCVGAPADSQTCTGRPRTTCEKQKSCAGKLPTAKKQKSVDSGQPVWSKLMDWVSNPYFGKLLKALLLFLLGLKICSEAWFMVIPIRGWTALKHPCTCFICKHL